MNGRAVLSNAFFAIALASGCVSIDSTKHEDRMAAVSRVNDQKILGGYVENAKYDDVKTAALEKITDSETLLEIVKNGRVDKTKLFMAVDQIRDDETLLAVASAGNVDSDLRCRALGRLDSEQIISKALRISHLDVLERKKALERIKDPDLLADILLDSNLPADIRKEAAPKVTEESVLLRSAMDRTMPEEERNRIARRLRSGESCERVLLAGGLSESVQRDLANRLPDDPSRIRVISARSVSVPVRRSLVGILSNRDAVLAIALDKSISEGIREEAADALCNEPSLLVELFRKAEDLQGAILGLARLPDEESSSPSDQNKILGWFKQAECSEQSMPAMKLLAGKMTTEQSLWYVAEESCKAPESMRENCLSHITDSNLLVRAACRTDDSLKFREIALNGLRGDAGSIRRVFRECGDANGKILSLQFLPEDDVRDPETQQNLAEWLLSLSETEEELDLSVRILQMLAPETEVDGEAVQGKIAKVLAARDTEDLRAVVRKLLVDPNSIESLVVERFGENPSLAAWAVELIAGDNELEKAVARAKDAFVKCRAASRIRSEAVLVRIAEGKEDDVVRFVAARHLGPESEEVLGRLARSPDPVVAEGSLEAIRRFNEELAGEILAERESAEARRKAARERFLLERAEQARANSIRDIETDRRNLSVSLRPEFENFDIRSRIRDCRDWSRLKARGVRIGEPRVAFPGRVTEVATHWISRDEVWISVAVSGDSFTIHARIRNLDGFAGGDSVLIEGSFESGTDSEATLENATISHL